MRGGKFAITGHWPLSALWRFLGAGSILNATHPVDKAAHSRLIVKRTMGSLRIALILLLFPSAIALAVRSDSANPQTDQEKPLSEVRSHALTYTARLPNFICTQVTKRDSHRANTRLTNDSGVMSPYYGASDAIVEKLTFFDQKENYEVVSINDKKTSETHGELTGASSAALELSHREQQSKIWFRLWAMPRQRLPRRQKQVRLLHRVLR